MMLVGHHVWRTGACLVGLMTLAGCDALLSPEIEDCERFVMGKLRSPSTYSRIEAHKTPMGDRKPPQIWVSIEYDAANAYGTLIRATQICSYPLVNGHADLSKYIDHNAPLEDISTIDEAISSGNAGGPDAANAISDSDTQSTVDSAMEESRDSSSSSRKEDKLLSKRDSGSEPIPKAELCREGYCPCEPPQGGADQLLCDQLKLGKADPVMLSVGKSMRDVRRQIAESDF